MRLKLKKSRLHSGGQECGEVGCQHWQLKRPESLYTVLLASLKMTKKDDILAGRDGPDKKVISETLEIEGKWEVSQDGWLELDPILVGQAARRSPSVDRHSLDTHKWASSVSGTTSTVRRHPQLSAIRPRRSQSQPAQHPDTSTSSVSHALLSLYYLQHQIDSPLRYPHKLNIRHFSTIVPPPRRYPSHPARATNPLHSSLSTRPLI